MKKLLLGKKPAEHDLRKRTIQLSSILRDLQLPPLPPEWRFTDGYPQFDLTPKMWGNDTLGDCVEVATSAQFREWEVIQEDLLIPITQEEVTQGYLKEAGSDEGLVVLDHMKYLKNTGIILGGYLRKIDAFARINITKQSEIQYAIYLVGLGAIIGLSLPDNFRDEIEAGLPWKDTSEPANPENGHGVKPEGWTKDGIIFWTWGQWQLATWDWAFKYMDEGFAMVADKDEQNDIHSPLDIPKLEAYLEVIGRICYN